MSRQAEISALTRPRLRLRAALGVDAVSTAVAIWAMRQLGLIED